VTGIRISSVSLDGIARSAGLNRPSLAAAFGDKDAIYAKAAAQYVAMIDARVSEALSLHDLGSALRAAFDAAIDIYTAGGPDGCFVICTAPAEALDQSLEKIDAVLESPTTGQTTSIGEPGRTSPGRRPARRDPVQPGAAGPCRLVPETVTQLGRRRYPSSYWRDLIGRALTFASTVQTSGLAHTRSAP
jgi:AcrR family transcriptional regulator